MVRRSGSGRTKHLEAGWLWLQERALTKEPHVGTIDTTLNSADLGTKFHPRRRFNELLMILPLRIGVGLVGGEEQSIVRGNGDASFTKYFSTRRLHAQQCCGRQSSSARTCASVALPTHHRSCQTVGKAPPVLRDGSLLENDKPVVLGAAGTASGTKETTERYLICPFCGANGALSSGRATKYVMVRALLSELEFDSAELNRKAAVTTL